VFCAPHGSTLMAPRAALYPAFRPLCGSHCRYGGPGCALSPKARSPSLARPVSHARKHLEAFGTAFWTVSNRCIERSRLQELLRPVRHDRDRQTGVFGALLGRVAPLGWGNLVAPLLAPFEQGVASRLI
jgi:hypothetical protein